MHLKNNINYLKPYRIDLRNNPSKAEDFLWGFIRKSRLGVKFRRQHSIGNFILDFYAPSIKLNIEVDGEQHDGSIEEDAKRDHSLKNQGIMVVRYSSLECLNKVDGVISDIVRIIKLQS